MKSGRLSLRLEEELLNRMREYAKDRGMPLTLFVERLFVKLLEEEDKKKMEVDQV